MFAVNAGLGLLVSFGVTLSQDETAAIETFVNASLAIAVHFGHRIGESVASGASAAVSARANEQAADTPREAA